MVAGAAGAVNGYGNAPVAAFTWERGPSAACVPAAVPVLGVAHPGPRLQFPTLEQVPHSPFSRAQIPWSTQLMPIISIRPSFSLWRLLTMIGCCGVEAANVAVCAPPLQCENPRLNAAIPLTWPQ